MKDRTFTSLNRSVGWFVASYGLAIIGYLALNAAASRLVGPKNFGSLMVVLTTTTLLGQLGLVGVHRSGLREAARIDDHGSEELGVLKSGVRAVLWVTLPVVSVLTGAITWLLSGSWDPTTRLWIGIFSAALVYLNGIQKLTSCYLRGLGHLRISGLLEGRSGGALVAVGQAAFMVAILLFVPSAGYVGALAGVTVGFAIPVFWAWHRLNKVWKDAPVTTPLWPALNHVMHRDWKFALLQVGSYGNSATDLWLCAIILPGNPTSMFGAAQRLSQLLLIPMTSLQVVFSPAIARLTKSDRRRLQNLLRTGSTIATVATSVLWVPMAFAPVLMVTILYGSNFAEAAPILVLLATGYMMNAVSGLSGITLSMSHQEGWVATVHWVGLVVRIGCGAAAAVLWGPIGLAATSMSATILIYLLMWIQAKRRIGIATHATLRPKIRLLSKVAG